MVKLIAENFEENGKKYSRLYKRGNGRAYIISANNTKEEQEEVFKAMKREYINATIDMYW